MRSLHRFTFAAVALTAAVSTFAQTSVNTEGALGANDDIDWSQFGYADTTGYFTNGVGYTHNGIQFTVSSVVDSTDQPTGAGLAVYQQDGPDTNIEWAGVFNAGDNVMYQSGSYADSQADLKITFASAVVGFGSAGQTNVYGDYEMDMGAWTGSSFLTSSPVDFSTNTGTSQYAPGTYPFMGVLSNQANITSVYLQAHMLDGSEDGGAGWSHTLIVDAPAVPEPAPFMALGLGGLVLLRKRKRS